MKSEGWKSNFSSQVEMLEFNKVLLMYIVDTCGVCVCVQTTM